MTLSLSERVVSQAINHPEIQTINMYMNGEPLLDQKLENRIRLANNKGIPYIRISTNATLLTPSRFLSLREAGLDEITISLDAPAQMKHESIRPGTNFNLIIEYLSLIIKEKKERKLLKARYNYRDDCRRR
jgi:molybdenum cofactor biosynthesis enzyme MoaA